MSTKVIDIDPERVLYPTGPGPAALCWTCFQPRRDLATTSDRRIAGGELVQTCGACFHALTQGRAVRLPTRDELPQLLLSWARWDTNGEVDEEFTARMLAALLPGLTAQDAACWLECLQGALLELQERRGPGFELISVEPEARDEQRLVDDSVEKAMECLEALLSGGAR
ncbi:hypothetical protein [Actinomadura sp. 21ATH]|uniref:hypothetical protein n=1 Tax=Actinomadura sp. 21ATH TaxID=1735444 RepID=UPI0035C1413D